MNDTQTSILERLQLDIASRLEVSPGFENIPVTALRPRAAGTALNIQTTLDKSLAGLLQKGGKGGVSCIVMMPLCDVNEPNIPGPELMVSVTVRVIENPLVNMGASGTGLSAETVSTNVLAALHLWDAGLSGSVLTAATQRASSGRGGGAMVPNFDNPAAVVYDCTVETRLGVTPARRTPPVRVDAAPFPEEDEHAVAMVCNDPSAAIFFTTDGTLPTPTNPAAACYDGLLSLPPGTLIRAAAYAPGRHGSNVTTVQIKQPPQAL